MYSMVSPLGSVTVFLVPAGMPAPPAWDGDWVAWSARWRASLLAW